MKNIISLLALASMVFLSGCASVPIGTQSESSTAKKFSAPSEGMSGVYVYRTDSAFGAALKKDVWIDQECIGETARGVFFYHEVDGDQEHTISTESEFSPNNLIIYMKKGVLYFVQQYIKFGAVVGGAGLEQKDEKTGQEEVSKLNLAIKGKCSIN
jgi:hypothetical protein